MFRAANASLLIAAATCLFAAGCVERRFVITTDPPNAVVYDERGLPLSGSPADKQFTYYGVYQFTLVKDGYKTTVVQENVKAPWYEWPLIDFVSENLLPFTIRDIRRLHYPLEPAESTPPEKVRSDGELLRQRGQQVGPQMLAK
jgi:hypothetical protein